MCDSERTESIRQHIDRLVSHSGDLRARFSEAMEELREGNLDEAALETLSTAIHLLEEDAAAFEELFGL